MNSVKCFKCGIAGHVSRKCPFAECGTSTNCGICSRSRRFRPRPTVSVSAVVKRCFTCGEPGHLSRSCPLRISIRPATRPAPSSGSPLKTNQSKGSTGKPAPRCRVCRTFEHHPLDCSPDQSSRPARRSVWDRLGPLVPRPKCSVKKHPYLKHSVDAFMFKYLCDRFPYRPGYVNLEFKNKVKQWRISRGKNLNALWDLPIRSDIEIDVQDVFNLRGLFQESPTAQPCHVPQFLEDTGTRCARCHSYCWDYPDFFYLGRTWHTRNSLSAPIIPWN
ncbi:uncharacterized protein LOC107043835 [Diachasma alloeum]|uniref:uncharacterized protein LOC107042047 n=2 Tax=Diachasma alloeum TaxID=454923 RepID=UPI00073838EC|nr:uncharacterized protein LOC107042047 [Diachasma alloeum]XP_015120541.1 uncharacterized protein LOC107043523 [Diachasma alloeum]XP_015120973.1 uncharacterized protein LOC107043835 [Diachasma alloeum]